MNVQILHVVTISMRAGMGAIQLQAVFANAEHAEACVLEVAQQMERGKSDVVVDATPNTELFKNLQSFRVIHDRGRFIGWRSDIMAVVYRQEPVQQQGSILVPGF